MKRRFENLPIILLLFGFLALERITDLAATEGSILTALISGAMDFLMSFPAILIGLSFHEYAHAKVSAMLGDPTPGFYGRVSLSPMAHIDPMGFVSLMFLGFGWGKPVPIDPRYYKNPRSGEILVGLAGVTMNLSIAIVVGLMVKGIVMVSPEFALSTIGSILLHILMQICWVNLMLMAFNLIPCPPLDGFGVIVNVFNLQNSQLYYKVQQYAGILLLVLIVFNIPSKLIVTPLIYLADFLYGTLMNLPWAYFLLVSPI